MKRTNPNFKAHAMATQENTEFVNELFDNLFGNLLDLNPVDSDTDEVPDFHKQLARFGKPHPRGLDPARQPCYTTFIKQLRKPNDHFCHQR